MKRILSVLLAALTLAAVVSCNNFDMTKSLKGKTFTYSMGNNMEIAFVFSKDGKTGTFEMKAFSHDYATQALATAAVYTTKTWVQQMGAKGTFTYDVKTREAVLTHTEALSPTAADPYVYAYITTLAAGQLSDPALTAISSIETMKVMFTQDSVALGGPFGTYYEGKGPFTASYKTVDTETSGGVTTTTTETNTETLTISATSITQAYSTVTVETVGSAAAVTTTDNRNYTYAVSKVFEVGSTNVKHDFADMWKDGNTVTFWMDQTKYERIQYTGATAPAAPTAADILAGNGLATATVGGTYQIDQRVDYADPMTLTHFGDSIISASLDAMRGL